MDLPHGLSGPLAALTAALDDPGIDLQAVLDALTADVTAAVPSFLGLRMTVLVDGWPVTVTTIDPDLAASGASLQLPLDPLAGAGPGSSVVFYAGRAGAFVDLAADTRYAYGLDGQVVLNGHLTLQPRTALVGVNGYDELTAINQAIGVLIEQGHPPDEAHDELLRCAADHGRGMPGAVADLLTGNGGH